MYYSWVISVFSRILILQDVLMKKIVFFIESLEGGGAEKSLTELVENMDRTKYDITVITVSNNEMYATRVNRVCHLHSLVKTCKPERFFHYNLNRLLYRFINTMPRRILHKIIIGNGYDIEVACCEGFTTRLIASSTNKNSNKIAFVHTDMENNHWTGDYYESFEEEINCYKKFTCISCVSQSVAAAFRNTFGIVDTVVVNHNPINNDAIKTMAQESLILDPLDCPQIISIGRLSAVKSFDRLLRVAKQLKEEDYRFRLLILGKGEKEEELAQYITENNLSEYVKLIGFQPNPYQYILNSDFFVCSSLAEGFNTAVVECIVLGKPIITTNCSGMKDAFGGKKCGIICENSEEALLEAIRNTLDNPRRFAKLWISCH